MTGTIIPMTPAAGADASDVAPITETVPLAPRPSRWTLVRRRAAQHPSLIAGAVIIVFYAVVAVIGQLWTPYPARELGAGAPLLPPSAEHWFGTDRLGRDVFSLVLDATMLDLGLVLLAVIFAFTIGTFIGTLAGFFGKVTDVVVLRAVEIIQAFPILLLALLIVQAAGPGFLNVVMVLAVLGIPNYIRLARAELMARRSSQYAEAARLAGAGSLRVAFRHLLPNSLGPLIAYSSINASWAILVAASLGYVGVGLPPGTPEWGALVAGGATAITSGDWWVAFFPAAAIVGLAVGFYLLGDGISDLLDPRRRRRSS